VPFKNVAVGLLKPLLEDGKPHPTSVRSPADLTRNAAPVKAVHAPARDDPIFLARESLIALRSVHFACHPYLAQTFCHAL
jgi:hypothetical protein